MDIKQARKLRTALECRSPRFVTSAVTIEGIRATRDGRIDTRAETDRNVVVFEAKVDGTTKSLVTFEPKTHPAPLALIAQSSISSGSDHIRSQNGP